jgi:sigma-E factor negative regulatory protein RseA
MGIDSRTVTEKNMTKETHEHLSCLMDGEISRETSRFLVRRLGADDELCATWARYHLVRDCLRHQDGGIANQDLCGNVRQALENEEIQKPASASSRRWLRPVAGIAVAASVALMAVVMVDPASKSAPPVSSELAGSAQAVPFTSPQSLGAGPVSRQASLSGGLQTEQKMNSYLLRHYQATGTSGKGFVTFVPIVITKNASDPEPVSNTDDLQSNDKSEDALVQ